MPQQQSPPSVLHRVEPTPPQLPQATGNKVHELISLQAFDGSWVWHDFLFKIMDLPPDDVERKLDWSAIFGDQSVENKKDEEKRRVVATLVVVSYFHTKWLSEKETWELLCDKAVDWATKKIGDMGGSKQRSREEWLKLFDVVFS